MHRNYFLFVTVVIYLLFLSECINSQDTNKADDKNQYKVTVNVPDNDLKKQQKTNDATEKKLEQPIPKENTLQNTQKAKYLKSDDLVTEKVSISENTKSESISHTVKSENEGVVQNLKIDDNSQNVKDIDNIQVKDVSQNDKTEDISSKVKEDSIVKDNKDEASDSMSSHTYKPSYINRGIKQLSAEEYLEALKKEYMEDLLKELGFNTDINKVKDGTKKASKEFSGTAEETVLFQEMSEEEYEELLKIGEINAEELKTEIPNSHLQSEDMNPNPSFSDLNAKEILHTLPDQLVPPEKSNLKDSASKLSESSGKVKKEPELTEEEKQGNLYFINSECSLKINILNLVQL